MISYKVTNTCEFSSELKDELNFQEFISKYKKVILAGKKMLMIMIVKDIIKKKNSINKHKKVNFFIICIYYKI